MNASVVCRSKKTRRKLFRRIFERIKESKLGTSRKLGESNILETQVIVPI